MWPVTWWVIALLCSGIWLVSCTDWTSQSLEIRWRCYCDTSLARRCSELLVSTRTISNSDWRRSSFDRESSPSSTRSWDQIQRTWRLSLRRLRSGWSAPDWRRLSGVRSPSSNVSEFYTYCCNLWQKNSKWNPLQISEVHSGRWGQGRPTPKPMMHIAFPPISTNFINPLFSWNWRFLLNWRVLLLLMLILMHLCTIYAFRLGIMLYT